MVQSKTYVGVMHHHVDRDETRTQSRQTFEMKNIHIVTGSATREREQM